MTKPKVFIVDDDPTFVKLLEHQLEKAKITPFETYVSGEECLENMHHKPRLVLLDFSLGGLNGLDRNLLTLYRVQQCKCAGRRTTQRSDGCRLFGRVHSREKGQ